MQILLKCGNETVINGAGRRKAGREGGDELHSFSIQRPQWWNTYILI